MAAGADGDPVSSIVPESGQGGTKAPARGDDAHLTRDEEQFIQRYLQRPESFPTEFWRAVIQKVALDGEPVPYTQVQGLSRFAFGSGTTLPQTPSNGQFFSLALGSGVVWNLRYNATSASAYKWEFIGGPPLVHSVAASEATTNNFYSDLTTDGPTLTIPFKGEYLVNLTARVQTSITDRCFVGLYVNGALSTETSIDLTGTWFGALQLASFQTISSANQVVKMRYKNVNGGTSTYSNRLLFITPVRIS